MNSITTLHPSYEFLTNYVALLWVEIVQPCPKDCGSMFLQIVGSYLHSYMAYRSKVTFHTSYLETLK